MIGIAIPANLHARHGLLGTLGVDEEADVVRKAAMSQVRTWKRPIAAAQVGTRLIARDDSTNNFSQGFPPAPFPNSVSLSVKRPINRHRHRHHDQPFSPTHRRRYLSIIQNGQDLVSATSNNCKKGKKKTVSTANSSFAGCTIFRVVDTDKMPTDNHEKILR